MSAVEASRAELPVWELPVTTTLIVSGALATRDFQDVHHDRELAVQRGSADIFLNILTTTGLVQRYVGDWARSAVGPDYLIRSCALRLGAPAYPHDALRFSGAITEQDEETLTLTVTGTLVSERPTDGSDHVVARVVVAGVVVAGVVVAG